LGSLFRQFWECFDPAKFSETVITRLEALKEMEKKTPQESIGELYVRNFISMAEWRRATICIIVDGIDESRESKDIASCLRGLGTRSKMFKVLVASRPDYLEDILNGVLLIEVNASTSSDDIKKHLEWCLLNDPVLKQMSHSMKMEVRGQLLPLHDGMLVQFDRKS
jgi:hypothetical protein